MRTLATTLAIAALVPALALSATARAQVAEERLSSPDLPGFSVGYAAANDTQAIREEVPQGETTQRWSRLVTTQRFAGLAQQITPEHYARRIIRSMKKRCAKAKVSDTNGFELGGRDAFQFQVECPVGASGRKEAFILLAVAGQSDMHVKQVAFRGQVIDSGLVWGKQFLKATRYCSADSEVCTR